ncbi:MAG: hypothetical protein F6J90_13995 [Moorea sp. SIOASIH]|uniref:hypothetical protein n=1 Tax=Moorena sp. SIOASIH TaxID=2607817 RepID=UPI0013B795A4|nr:hypothetical protein [Moorena sp. SIOASIH]NEO37373.1 hypothetical protein [Moorena sp. SIOASIH]
MGETTAVAHGGDHGSRSWGKPPLAALPPQDRTASPRPRCIAIAYCLARSAIPA